MSRFRGKIEVERCSQDLECLDANDTTKLHEDRLSKTSVDERGVGSIHRKRRSTLVLFSSSLFLLCRRTRVTISQVSPSNRVIGKYNIKPETIWWENQTEKLSRVYESKDNFSWCIPETSPTHDWRLNDKNEAQGLIYIKLYKASSSTCEGVSLSIANNVARRLTQNKKSSPCVHYNRHVFQDVGGLNYTSKTKSSTLVWTMVRNPIERELSSFYFFEVSRKNATISDEAIINYFRESKNFQTSYLLPWQTIPWNAGLEFAGKRELLVQWLENHILTTYDFIGVTERFEESLAVMVLLWDLETTDVIVMSAKQSGGYDDAGDTGRCTKILKPLSPSLAIQAYWSKKHAIDNVDFLLWEVANRSLDRTIHRLGRSKVDAVIAEIENLRKLADYWCAQKTHFPCSARGVKQFHLSEKSCYVQDAGCGHACVDKTMEKYHQGKIHFLSDKTIMI